MLMNAAASTYTHTHLNTKRSQYIYTQSARERMVVARAVQFFVPIVANILMMGWWSSVGKRFHWYSLTILYPPIRFLMVVKIFQALESFFLRLFITFSLSVSAHMQTHTRTHNHIIRYIITVTKHLQPSVHNSKQQSDAEKNVSNRYFLITNH